MQSNINNSVTQRSYKSAKTSQPLPQTLVPIKDIQETVGYTNKSSLLSKTIQYLRTQSELKTKVNIKEMVEMQRNKIYSHQNKLKVASIERETVNKETLKSVREVEEQRKEMKKKQIEEKLKMHDERLKNIQKEKNEKKGEGIMELFRRLGEAYDEQIEIPMDISVPQLQKASLNEIKEVNEQEKGLFSLTEYQVEKKKDVKKKKDQSNPFELYGSKEIIDKISDMVKNNQYDELDYLKAYKPRIEKVDPENRNLLSHKLWKALDDAAILWGHRKVGLKQRKLSAESLNSFERSMENILDGEKEERQEEPETRSKARSAGRFMYTKQHRKVKLF